MKYASILLFCLSCLWTSPIYTQTWTQINATGDVPALANASAFFDNANNRMIVFGGRSTSGFSDSIWSLDLDNYEWTEISPSSISDIPPARHTHNAHFDEANNRMIVYSGQGSGALYSDIWSFDFDALHWEELAPNGSGPSLRYGTASTIDVDNNRLIAFAGFASVGSRQDDTWAFNFDTNEWTEISPTSHPLKRCLLNGTLLAESDKMIIYGGQNGGNLGDIWAFDFTENDWTNLSPMTGPAARHFCSITAIDEEHLWMFGGNGSGQGQFSGGRNDLWEFSTTNNTWTFITPVDLIPPERVGHVAIFIPNENKLLIFGGNGTSGNFLDDVWVFTSPITAIEEPDNQNFTIESVFPNPFENSFFVKIRSEIGMDISIKLTDATGKDSGFILNEKTTVDVQTFQIEASEISNGVYFLTIENDGKIVGRKRILKH